MKLRNAGSGHNPGSSHNNKVSRNASFSSYSQSQAAQQQQQQQLFDELNVITDTLEDEQLVSVGMGSHVSSHLSGSTVMVEHDSTALTQAPREITRIENTSGHQQLQQDDGGFTNVISFLGNKLKDILAGDMVPQAHLSQT